MQNQFDRTIKLIEIENFYKIRNAKITIAGIGAVGSVTTEILARSGAQNIRLFDPDIVETTNINRQLYALHSTIGTKKVDAAKKRLIDINPNINPEIHSTFLNSNNIPELINTRNTHILLDCIDSTKEKITLIKHCLDNNIPIISSMGAARKTDPSQIKIETLIKTSHCPLARIIRKTLANHPRISNLTCVYSIQQPALPQEQKTKIPNEKTPLPSIMTVTAVFAAYIAHAAIEKILFHTPLE